MVYPTTGTLHMRLADSEPVFVTVGCSVSYHRTVLEPTEDAPFGIETVTVNSEAGFIDYEEVEGKQVLTYYAQEPVVESDPVG